MQARRQKVTYFQVLWPIFILFGAIVLVLTLWTAIDPLQWVRTEIDGAYPPESKGQCASATFHAYFWPCAGLIGVPTLCTIIAVWRTKDISQDLSDTSVTFYLVVTQFQAWLLGVPVLVVLGSASVDAEYLGRVLLIWLFAIAPLLIVLWPTIYRTIAKRVTPNAKPRRSSVHISGLSDTREESKTLSMTFTDRRNSSTVAPHCYDADTTHNNIVEPCIAKNPVKIGDATTCQPLPNNNLDGSSPPRRIDDAHVGVAIGPSVTFNNSRSNSAIASISNSNTYEKDTFEKQCETNDFDFKDSVKIDVTKGGGEQPTQLPGVILANSTKDTNNDAGQFLSI
jgi:hypothetical protein